MVRVIFTFCVSLVLLWSCNVESPPNIDEDCELFIKERRNERLKVSNDTMNDTLRFVVHGRNSAAFIIAKQELGPNSEDFLSYTIKQADSASQLFLLADCNYQTCAPWVLKGDTLSTDFTRKKSLHKYGISWSNSCEVLLASQSETEITCGPELFEILKIPFRLGTGDGANYGWFEFLISEHNFFLLKTNIAKHCDEVVVR